VVYTIPLVLMFSNDLEALRNRFGVNPKVLPMVRLQLRDGGECEEGMALLRQMVLARAFPDVEPQQQLALIPEVFDSLETLDRLCRVSGGNIRGLLRLLNNWITTNRNLPLSREGLEAVIRVRCNQMALAITDDEWELLHQRAQQQWERGEEYQTLLRSMFVFEYQDEEGGWFSINPILAEAGRLN
jgi:hypothetical protein